jgi:mannose-6-phosphate isomerase-like protein (cupin superfamily)
MRLFGRVDKSWGYEDIFISNNKYCAKYLVFDKAGNKTSMHFHKEKEETWTVIQGSFLVRYIYTDVAETKERILTPGDVDAKPIHRTFNIEALMPHQLIALEDDSIMLEVSTADSVEDNYRLYR